MEAAIGTAVGSVVGGFLGYVAGMVFATTRDWDSPAAVGYVGVGLLGGMFVGAVAGAWIMS